jgi:hypothetical protein
LTRKNLEGLRLAEMQGPDTGVVPEEDDEGEGWKKG